jgi:hypothetical protein
MRDQSSVASKDTNQRFRTDPSSETHDMRGPSRNVDSQDATLGRARARRRLRRELKEAHASQVDALAEMQRLLAHYIAGGASDDAAWIALDKALIACRTAVDKSARIVAELAKLNDSDPTTGKPD